jgi:multicomponent Na+:H+ antiporter subunit G
MINILSSFLILAGLFFYLAGSIGLLRLPDLYSRLHALTKADNLGLGLLITGIALYAQDLLTALKLLLIWLAVLAASAASAHLIARHTRREEAGL